MVEGPQSVDSRSQERLEGGDTRPVRSSRPREVIRVGPWLFVGGVASLTLLFGREHSSRFGDCANLMRASPVVSGRLWHVLCEERTHAFCVCVLRARDAEHFACRGSFVCVRVLVDVSARVRCIVVANL